MIERALSSFEDKFMPEPMSGCWLWMGSEHTSGEGYGVFNSIHMPGKSTWLSHRAAWTLYRGDIPSGIIVCHKCDNPACVNPDHLFLGTDKDNVADAVRKGRHQSPLNPCYQKGSKRSRSILTEDQVREGRSRYSGGEAIESIHKRLLSVIPSLKYETVRHAIKGLSWKGI